MLCEVLRWRWKVVVSRVLPKAGSQGPGLILCLHYSHIFKREGWMVRRRLLTGIKCTVPQAIHSTSRWELPSSTPTTAYVYTDVLCPCSVPRNAPCQIARNALATSFHGLQPTSRCKPVTARRCRLQPAERWQRKRLRRCRGFLPLRKRLLLQQLRFVVDFDWGKDLGVRCCSRRHIAPLPSPAIAHAAQTHAPLPPPAIAKAA